MADEWVGDVACDQDTVALSAVEFFEPAEMDRLLCGEQKPWYTPQTLTPTRLLTSHFEIVEFVVVQIVGCAKLRSDGKLFGLCRTLEERREACHADHGYTLDAPAVQVPPHALRLVVVGKVWDVAEWSCFGLWCSGCSRRLWG